MKLADLSAHIIDEEEQAELEKRDRLELDELMTIEIRKHEEL
jgi:hypothetical protein